MYTPVRSLSRGIVSTGIACVTFFALAGLPALAESEAGLEAGTESGGIYNFGETESGGPSWVSESGGPFVVGESESGGPTAIQAQSESGGVLASEAGSESGGVPTRPEINMTTNYGVVQDASVQNDAVQNVDVQKNIAADHIPQVEVKNYVWPQEHTRTNR